MWDKWFVMKDFWKVLNLCYPITNHIFNAIQIYNHYKHLYITLH